MSRRSPARFLAPLALIAVVVLVVLVASSADLGGGSAGPAAATTATTASPAAEAARTTTAPSTGRRFYTVKPGDTPSGIAEQTGVGLDRLIELNPDLDPQTLSPGTRLRLREG